MRIYFFLDQSMLDDCASGSHLIAFQDMEQKMKMLENLQDDFDFNYKTLKSAGGKDQTLHALRFFCHVRARAWNLNFTCEGFNGVISRLSF